MDNGQEGPSIKALEFQAIIRARKEEVRAKTEDKRQESMKILEVRALEDEEEPSVNICGLPNEMWKEIIIRIDDPDDVKSMWKAYPRFRPLSDKSQTMECLLAQLLRIEKLLFLWYRKKNPDERILDLMLLRSVSSRMRNAVDRYLDVYFIKCLHGNRQTNESAGFSTWLHDTWMMDDCLARYNDGPVESSAKRFCNRSISIRRWDIQTEPEHLLGFKGKLISLLEIVGNQIWHASFCLVHHDPPNAEASILACYLFLLESVRLMPNLKWIELSFLCTPESKASQKMPALSPDTYANHLFPHMPQLERIGLMYFTNFLPKFEIVTKVLRRNSHIKFLGMNEFLEGTETEELMALLSMLNLDTFTYRNRPQRFSGGVPLQLRSLLPVQPLVDANCNLNDLNISLKNQDGIQLDSVFNFVNNFPSLENLSIIWIGGVTFGGIFQLSPLKLPNLLRFKLEMHLGNESIDFTNAENIVSLFSLQFLMHSKRLKCLAWALGFGSLYRPRKKEKRAFRKKLQRIMINHERHEEMINFRGGFRDLTHSNIWDVFPELEHVKTWILRGPYDEYRNIYRPKFFKF